MWHSPILNVLPYHHFMAPPLGLAYGSYPFTPWLNPTRPMDTQQPMFWPQLQLNKNSSQPTVGVLESELAKVDKAILKKDQDESHSRFIKHFKLSPSTDISPKAQPTPLRYRDDQTASNRSHLSSWRVHSPPILGSYFAIPSPNAASTPLKPLEQKQKPVPRSYNNDKFTTQESTTELTADIKTDQESEAQPLDLRVRKRRPEDCDDECHRDAKKFKVEFITDIQTPGRNSTSNSNKDVNLISYSETISSESDSLGSKPHMGLELLRKGDEGKRGREASAGNKNKTKRSSNSSNVSYMYLSSGYDSGVVLDTTESVNAHEENILLIKSGVCGIFYCQHCGYKTSEKLEAGGHMEVHCDHVIKQRCLICEKEFSFSGDIARHVLQSHQPSDTRAMKCTEPNSNEASLSQEKLFNFHLRFDHGEKSYKCLQSGCGKSFSTKSTLKHHQFVHTDIFKCTWTGCGKRFRDDYNLRTHFMIHTGKKPRQCPQCDYSCVQKNSMDWHMKTKHKSCN